MKAIFLDRDGTLNKDIGYTYKISDLKLIRGVKDGLKKLQEKYGLFIISSQSGVGRGKFSSDDVEIFNKELMSRLAKEKINIKKAYYCPHHPDDGCPCRKPETFLIEMAAKEFHIDWLESWVIGDKEADIQMGKNCGMHTVLVLTGKNDKKSADDLNVQPDFIAKNLDEAAEMILKQLNSEKKKVKKVKKKSNKK